MKILIICLVFPLLAFSQWEIEPNTNPDAKELTYKLISPDTLQLNCDCIIKDVLLYNVFEPKIYHISGYMVKIPLLDLYRDRYTVMVAANRKLIVFKLLKP